MGGLLAALPTILSLLGNPDVKGLLSGLVSRVQEARKEADESTLTSLVTRLAERMPDDPPKDLTDALMTALSGLQRLKKYEGLTRNFAALPLKGGRSEGNEP